MHRTIKALALAGAIAAGLPLASGRADAQVPGWNVIRPTSCFHSVATNSAGQYVYTAYVYTNTFTVTLVDPVSIGAALQWCYSGSAFWGYFAGPSVWTMLYVTPGLK
jgi:hypothetical protein